MNSKLFVIALLLPTWVSGRIGDVILKNIADGKTHSRWWILSITLWCLNSIPYYYCLKYNEFGKTELMGSVLLILSAMFVASIFFHEQIFTVRRMLAFGLALAATIAYK